jgi:hypothetical protein
MALYMATTSTLFLCDALGQYGRGRVLSEGETLEAEIAALRARLWSDPGDRRELEGLIEQLEARLRRLRANGERA